MPLIAGPIWTETRVSFGTPGTVTGSSPLCALPAVPVSLTEYAYGEVPSRVPYFSPAAAASLFSNGTSVARSTGDFSMAGLTFAE